MQDLNIHLIINPECELVAVDNTVYHNLRYTDGDEYLDDLLNHVSLELLIDHMGHIDSNHIYLQENIGARQEFLNGNMSVFKFHKDGTFTYYKYLIPKLNHLLKYDDAEVAYYKTRDQLFYNNGKFYYAKEDYSTIEELNKNVIEINNLLDLWNFQGTQTFSFQKIIFSVCKLQKCLVSLQRQMLNDYGKCVDKNAVESNKTIRDFLFSTMYVFDYLKDHDNYEEAQRILDNLINCTGNICPEYNYKSECNCGKVI